MKYVSCRDLGKDCDYVAEGNTPDEVVQKLTEHAKTDHKDIKPEDLLKPEFKQTVYSKIRDRNEGVEAA